MVSTLKKGGGQWFNKECWCGSGKASLQGNTEPEWPSRGREFQAEQIAGEKIPNCPCTFKRKPVWRSTPCKGGSSMWWSCIIRGTDKETVIWGPTCDIVRDLDGTSCVMGNHFGEFKAREWHDLIYLFKKLALPVELKMSCERQE